MAEDYVRPPILGAEAPSRRAATWRFRLVMTVIVLIVAAAIVLAIRWITGGGEGGGTVGLHALTSLAGAAAR